MLMKALRQKVGEKFGRKNQSGSSLIDQQDLDLSPPFLSRLHLYLRKRKIPPNPAAVKAMVEDSGTGAANGGTAGLPETIRLSILMLPAALEAPSNTILKAVLGLWLSPGIPLRSKL